MDIDRFKPINIGHDHWPESRFKNVSGSVILVIGSKTEPVFGSLELASLLILPFIGN